jgi:transposase-like protein
MLGERGIVVRPRCPYCGSKRVMKIGFNVTLRGRFQRYKCNNCGHSFQSDRPVKEKRRKKK